MKNIKNYITETEIKITINMHKDKKDKYKRTKDFILRKQ